MCQGGIEQKELAEISRGVNDLIVGSLSRQVVRLFCLKRVALQAGFSVVIFGVSAVIG